MSMDGTHARRALTAGAAYFALVFAAGFALGVVRTLALLPLLGESVAVLVELPVILTIAWLACGWLVRRLDPMARWPARAVMGGTAFVLLMVAEALLATLGQGVSLTAHVDGYVRLPRLIGLAGQVAFALMPLLRRQTG